MGLIAIANSLIQVCLIANENGSHNISLWLITLSPWNGGRVWGTRTRTRGEPGSRSQCVGSHTSLTGTNPRPGSSFSLVAAGLRPKLVAPGDGGEGGRTLTIEDYARRRHGSPGFALNLHLSRSFPRPQGPQTSHSSHSGRSRAGGADCRGTDGKTVSSERHQERRGSLSPRRT